MTQRSKSEQIALSLAESHHRSFAIAPSCPLRLFPRSLADDRCFTDHLRIRIPIPLALDRFSLAMLAGTLEATRTETEN